MPIDTMSIASAAVKYLRTRENIKFGRFEKKDCARQSKLVFQKKEED